jgi:hypothetical protein
LEISPHRFYLQFYFGYFDSFCKRYIIIKKKAQKILGLF